MNDRKLRTIGLLSLFTGTAIVLVIMLMYALETPGAIMIPVLMIYTFLQFRIAPSLYNAFYRSKLADLPQGLQKRFPPPQFQDQNAPCDILLIRPPSAVLSGPDCGEALGLGYLASMLREVGYQVTILDARLQKLDVMQTAELAIAYHPKAIGVNLNFQYLAPVTLEMLQALRKRKFNGHITLGGLYASVAPEFLLDKMPEVDTIVRFEGEETYLELMQNLDNEEIWPDIAGLVFRNSDGKTRLNPLRPLIPDIDKVPHPARDHLGLTIQQGGYAYLISSRGCRGNCAYCVQSRSVSDPHGKRWRGRDPEDVVDEIERFVQEKGARLISFVDDDIFGPTRNGENNAHRLAQAIIARDLDVILLTSVQPRDVKPDTFALLKQAGLKSVILAVDNFSQSVLNRLQKYSNVNDNLRSISILNELGIDAYLGIIMFDPLTTLDELEENARVMMDIPAYLRPWQILSKLEIYHGSPLTESFDSRGLLKWDGFFASYQFVDPRIEGVYSALEVIIKEAYPVMAELDAFRWGNINFSEADQLVLDNFNDRFIELNRQFNRDILSMAMDIIQKQQASDTALALSELADEAMQEQARLLSRQTKKELEELREMAGQQTV